MYRRNEPLRTGDFTLNARDDELLELLKIRALPSEVEIYRHRGGFVVFRLAKHVGIMRAEARYSKPPVLIKPLPLSTSKP